MNLNVDNWKSFKIKDIFPILETGKANQGILSDGNDCFYVGAKREDNGVMFRCQRDELLVLKGNCIIFICNGEGSVGYANYMDRDFIGTTDIVAGYNKKINCLSGLFLATVISQERPKYSFGRKWKTHLKDTVIKLPYIKKLDNTYEPDWKFMEDYIKSLHYRQIITKNKIDQIKRINISDWKEFYVGGKRGVFDCSTTSLSVKEQLEIGFIPLVSRTATNNGIDGYFKVDNEKITKGNCITIGAEGVVGFYQLDNFCTGNKVYTLRNKHLNKYNALFVTTILNKEDYRYSYGRARIKRLLENEIIKLPAKKISNTKKYEPDWKLMEEYIKSLPYGDKI